MPATVLIVDDMAILREPMTAAVRQAGYEVLQAGTGQQALHQVRTNNIDVIVLDVAMPEMDGLTFLRHLRLLPQGRHTHVILLTADGGRETVMAAATLGVRDYMLKTAFSLRELLARIARGPTPPAAIASNGTPPSNGHAPASAGASTDSATLTSPETYPPSEIQKSAINGADTSAATAALARLPRPPPPPPAAPPASTTRQDAPPKPVTATPVPAASASPAVPPPSASSPADRGKLLLLTRDQTRLRLEEITGTRTCAGVVAQVMALANSPNTDINDLVRVIETDPILASRVLNLANSAMFRTKYKRLTTIDEAVRKVGMRAIQNAVLSIGIFQAFPPDEKDGFNTMRCWQHSFAVAAILRELMAHRNEEERERVALVGLCHDLGEIVLRQHFADEYQKILQHAATTGQSIANVEFIALSMRHGELVSEVLTRIGLPPNVAIPIMRFHEANHAPPPGSNSPPPPREDLETLRLLQIANGLAHGMLLVGSSDAGLAPLIKADLKRACGNDQIDIDLTSLRNGVLAATNSLARLPTSDEARFMAPLHPPGQGRVWYARHPSYADLDPLALALGLLAKPRIEQRLPRDPGELEACDLILITAPFLDSGPAMTNEIRALQKRPDYRKQPFLVLLGNAVAAPKIPNVTFFSMTLPIKTLAEALPHN